MDDMKDFGLWDQDFKSNEQLRVMDDMNDSRFYQFKPLCVMNCLGLQMTLINPSHELSTLDTMNTSGLWLTWTTLGCKLKNLDAMKNSGVWMRWTTPDHELKAWMLWTT